MSIKRTFGKARQQFNRGSTWINMPVTTIGILSANIRLFQDAIISFGYPAGYMWVLYLMSGPLYLYACYLVGAVDDRFGIWRDENDYQWHVTPIAMKLVRNVDNIARRMGVFEDDHK